MRYHLQVIFGSDEEMQAFKARIKRVRKLVSPGDGGEVENVGLLGAMMDVVESKSSTRDQRSSSLTGVAAGVAMQSFLRNSGIYTGDTNCGEVLPCLVIVRCRIGLIKLFMMYAMFTFVCVFTYLWYCGVYISVVLWFPVLCHFSKYYF